LALQQKYFSHSRLLIHCFQSPTHRHGIWTIKGEDQLIENHLHQSIYLANQYHVLNYVVIFANLSILNKHLGLKSFLLNPVDKFLLIFIQNMMCNMLMEMHFKKIDIHHAKIQNTWWLAW